MLKNLHTVIHERQHVYIIFVCSCVSVCVVLCIYLTLFSLLFLTISCSLSCSICTCTLFISSVYYNVCRYTHTLGHTFGLHYMWKRGQETRRRRVENEIRGKKRKKKKKGKRRKKIIKILYK